LAASEQRIEGFSDLRTYHKARTLAEDEKGHTATGVPESSRNMAADQEEQRAAAEEASEAGREWATTRG
jgi:hypothetical protein